MTLHRAHTMSADEKDAYRRSVSIFRSGCKPGQLQTCGAARFVSGKFKGGGAPNSGTQQERRARVQIIDGKLVLVKTPKAKEDNTDSASAPRGAPGGFRAAVVQKQQQERVEAEREQLQERKDVTPPEPHNRPQSQPASLSQQLLCDTEPEKDAGSAVAKLPQAASCAPAPKSSNHPENSTNIAQTPPKPQKGVKKRKHNERLWRMQVPTW